MGTLYRVATASGWAFKFPQNIQQDLRNGLREAFLSYPLRLLLLLSGDQTILHRYIDEGKQCSSEQWEIYRRFGPGKVETIRNTKCITDEPEIVKRISGCRIREIT